ncbi:hypothetical protein N7492_010210 [Penicillium capsulatum]|uniref:Uncharacterized protein n=1 Tax=Penicillium capsulatum TaxID=69766 RepID=A0A9W9HNJ7_9EURO|nr:hypothetical protein N7492_010210 [Penicillium capsulatum]
MRSISCTQPHVQPRAWKDGVDSFQDEIKGIYWDKAADSCTEEEMGILVKATREAEKMTALAMSDDNPTESASWNRYFVKDNVGALKNTWSTNWEIWTQIMSTYAFHHKSNVLTACNRESAASHELPEAGQE